MSTTLSFTLYDKSWLGCQDEHYRYTKQGKGKVTLLDRTHE